MKNSQRFIWAVCALVIAFGLLPSSRAEETLNDGRILIDVGQASVKQSLLALPSFVFYSSDSANSKNVEIGQKMFDTVQNDLTVTGLFTLIKPAAYLEDVSKVGLRPAPQDANGFDFAKWKTIGTDFLIRGGYRVTAGKIALEIYVYFVPQAKLVFGKTYEAPIESYRQIAHTFANDVLKNLTGKPGMFMSQIVVSSNQEKKQQKEVYIMDWDGQNLRKITNHQSIAISPTWSPDNKKVAYTAFAYHKGARTRNADLFVYESKSGRRWLVSYRKGINSGAAYDPEGKYLYLTISQGGNPDIYRMTVDGNTLTRITDGPGSAMNVEPAISPDGTKIAFSSDRSGRPMVYVMNIDGSNVKRITWGGKYNSTPSWSPDGKTLAFAGQDKSHFDIFTVSVDGKNMKRLTDARRKNGTPASNEDPTFSPDGRHIMFVSDRNGNRQLYMINVDGTNERRITTDHYDYFKPKWSTNVDSSDSP